MPDGSSHTVSVIIPAYNADRWVARAIQSVLCQDWPGVEAIVVNDGSTDDTEQVCLSFGGRIRYVRQDNAGASAARNRGIELARSEMVGFLDADDEYLPHALERLASLLLEFSHAGAASGAFLERVGPAQQRCPPPGRVLGMNRNRGIVEHFFRVYAKVALVCTDSVLVRREVFGHIGAFRTDMRRGEDMEMWCRIAGQYDWAFLDEPVAVYHLRPGSSLCSRYPELPTQKLYDEQLMRQMVRPQYWDDYRVYRRDIVISRARPLLARRAMANLQQAMTFVEPVPVSMLWCLLKLILRVPSWLVLPTVKVVIRLKKTLRRQQ